MGAVFGQKLQQLLKCLTSPARTLDDPTYSLAKLRRKISPDDNDDLT
jgi:hypothetical protein